MSRYVASIHDPAADPSSDRVGRPFLVYGVDVQSMVRHLTKTGLTIQLRRAGEDGYGPGWLTWPMDQMVIVYEIQRAVEQANEVPPLAEA